MIYPEATYLVWVDCSGLGLTDKALENLVVKKANLWLDSGRIFGKVGRGFQRFNVACPRKTLKQALEQFKKAKGYRFPDEVWHLFHLWQD